MNRPPYADRRDAGRVTAGMLLDYRDVDGLVVLGLPRGGVPVADEVARALDATLDVLVVRKLGAPGHPEFAMGAIASLAGIIETVVNPRFRAEVGAGGRYADDFDEVVAAETAELRRRQEAYRGDRGALDLRGRVVILVDDGLATGSTMRAASAAVRSAQPDELIAAVPVALSDARPTMPSADHLVCAWNARDLFSVGEAYVHFEQTTDLEVREILAAAARRRAECS